MNEAMCKAPIDRNIERITRDLLLLSEDIMKMLELGELQQPYLECAPLDRIADGLQTVKERLLRLKETVDISVIDNNKPMRSNLLG